MPEVTKVVSKIWKTAEWSLLILGSVGAGLLFYNIPERPQRDPSSVYSTQLYDREGNPAGEAPESAKELKAIFLTGNYGFLKGTRINWTKPDGSVGSLPSDAAKVMEALDADYQIETADAREQRRLKEWQDNTRYSWLWIGFCFLPFVVALLLRKWIVWLAKD